MLGAGFKPEHAKNNFEFLLFLQQSIILTYQVDAMHYNMFDFKAQIPLTIMAILVICFSTLKPNWQITLMAIFIILFNFKVQIRNNDYIFFGSLRHFIFWIFKSYKQLTFSYFIIYFVSVPMSYCRHVKLIVTFEFIHYH